MPAVAANLAPPAPSATHDEALPTRPDRAAGLPPVALGQNETQVGRYTVVATEPDEADANPLAVIAKVHFPREVVNTVGEAVRYVLIRTGYQLVAENALDARVKAVFGLRLPDNQRVLGPYRVDAMLGVLMGQPYRLVADPGSRTVTYIAPAAHSNAPVLLQPALVPEPAAATRSTGTSSTSVEPAADPA